MWLLLYVRLIYIACRSVSSRNDCILFSTKGPPALQRVPWPGNPDDTHNGFKTWADYSTWVLNDEEFPWLIDADGIMPVGWMLQAC